MEVAKSIVVELLNHVLTTNDSNRLCEYITNNKRKLIAVQNYFKQDIACCFNDGMPLDNPDIFVKAPCGRKLDGSFKFFPYKFCNLACALAFVSTQHFNPHLVVWFMLYAKQTYKITGKIRCAPERSLLNVYRMHQDGINLATFRNSEHSYQLVDRSTNEHIQPTIWKQEEQKNTDVPFHTVIRNQEILAAQLYQDWLDEGKTIPKTLLDARLQGTKNKTGIYIFLNCLCVC